MNKIEEILNQYGMSEIPFDENITMYYPALINAMVEFGRLAFNAGRKFNKMLETDGYDEYKYKTCEDFLKEIEDVV